MNGLEIIRVIGSTQVQGDLMIEFNHLSSLKITLTYPTKGVQLEESSFLRCGQAFP